MLGKKTLQQTMAEILVDHLQEISYISPSCQVLKQITHLLMK